MNGHSADRYRSLRHAWLWPRTVRAAHRERAEQRGRNAASYQIARTSRDDEHVGCEFERDRQQSGLARPEAFHRR